MEDRFTKKFHYEEHTLTWGSSSLHWKARQYMLKEEQS